MIDCKRHARFAARILAAGVLGAFAWFAKVGAQVTPAPGQPLPTQALPGQALPAQPTPAAPAEPPVPQFQVEVMIFAHRDFDRSEELFENEPLEIRPAEDLRAPPVIDDTTFGLPVQDPNALLDPAAPQGAGAAQNPGAPQNPAASQSPLDPGLGAGENPLGGGDPALDPAGSELAPLGADPLAAVDDTEFRFRLLQPEELQLTSQYRVIERNAQAYVPLLHGGWIQPGLPENEARPFDLTMLGATNPVGSIRLYLSRFLHVNLDLSYLDTATAAAATAPTPLGDELAEVPVTPRYHLEADRTTRSGELHYFDHPAFGVLIKVTPVRLEPTPTGTPGTRPAA